jgi:tetratricopeptide (TPR) repeat protein
MDATTGSNVIGREREMAALAVGFADAVAGRTRLFLLTGDPGIGKTRLAREAADRATANGALALWGRCWEAGGAPEYWPWVQILRALLAGAADDEAAAELGGGLQGLLPEPRTPAGRLEQTFAQPAETDAQRFRLFDAVGGLLSRLAARRPLVLVLDDLHAADASSLGLLLFVARSFRDARLLVVGTLRDVEARRERSRARLLADLARDAETLSLSALGAAEIARLVEGEMGHRSDVLADSVYRVSEGNPLVAHEAIRVLRDRPDRWRDATFPGMEALVRDRLDGLSPACAELLAVAAVIGRDFDVSDLREATTAAPERVLDLIGEAEAAGVIQHRGHDDGVYGFAHGLLREALYGALPPARLAQLHERVGSALERRYGADPGPRLGELARHFAEAAVGSGEVGKAVDYGRRAGDRARALFAFSEAADHYRRTLRLLGAGEAQAGARCELLLALGTACTQAGDVRSGRDAFAGAAELARRTGDVTHLARAAIGMTGRGDLFTHIDRETIAMLDEALERLGGADPALRARLLTRLAKTLYYAGEPERVTAAAAEALALARASGDPALLAAALEARHFALWGPGPSAEKLAVADELIVCGRATRSRELELSGHFWRFADLLEAGDLLGATTALGHYEQIAAELHQPFFFWRAASHRAALAILQGRFDDAAHLVREASDAAVRVSSRNPALIAGIQLYVLERERQPSADMVAGLRAMADENPSMPSFRAALAHCLAELDQAEEARAAFEAVAAAGFAHMPRDANWFSMMGELAETAAFLGDTARAAELYALLLPFADQVIVTGLADLCEGAVARHLGTLAASLARWPEASSHFERALEIDGRLGARPYLARTRLAFARMLMARGGDGDRSRAASLLDEAGALAETVGMRALRQRVDAARAALAARGAPAGELLRLDGKVWTVSYEGTIAHVKDGKGMRYLAHLLASPGVECHALDLYAAVAGSETATIGPRELLDEGLSIRRGTGVGPALDERARQDYRRRLGELRAELEDAEANRDLGRAERARREIDTLEGALAAAYGLGGRVTPEGSAAERARVSVTKAIRQAIEHIDEAHPGLGARLRQSVRTGRFFAIERLGE